MNVRVFPLWTPKCDLGLRFTFEDFGYEGDGLVHICHCANCGAEIEYRIPIPNEEEADKEI